MARIRRPSLVRSLVSLLLPTMLCATALAGDETISPSHMGEWVIKTINGAKVSFVKGPDTPPKGTGSLRLETGPGDGANKGGKIWIGCTAWNDRMLATIGSFSLSIYVESAKSASVAPYINVHLDYNNNGKWDGTQGGDMILVFDPTLQPLPKGQLDMRTGSWFTGLADSDIHYADHNTGGWWIVGHEDIAGRNGNSVKFADLLAKLGQHAIVANTFDNVPAIVIVCGARDGGTFSSFVGNITNVTISEQYRGPTTTLFAPDSEVAPPPPVAATPKPTPPKAAPAAAATPTATDAAEADEEAAANGAAANYPATVGSVTPPRAPQPVLAVILGVLFAIGIGWLGFLIFRLIRIGQITG
ncbi:MAG: hypothetical protein K8S99_07190 [Planctomycetes bacterium]|nr:hypothetical protein [Planctomycetota bacterium]